MSRLIAARKRLVRVRDVQHSQAVVALNRAQDEASQIATNARRLAQVREELYGHAGRSMARSMMPIAGSTRATLSASWPIANERLPND